VAGPVEWCVFTSAGNKLCAVAPTPSHRLKLDRAAEHVDDLQAFVAEAGKRCPYPVVESFDPEHKRWLYRLLLDQVEPPEMFPPDCITELRRLQPYETARHFQARPHDQALAVLSMLQNADKHRELVGIVTGLRQIQVNADGEVYGLVGRFANGALMRMSPRRVNVQIEGSVAIGVGQPNAVRDFHQLCEEVLEIVLSDVLPRLEPFLPGGSRHQTNPPTA
jgi:hypothetical protein